MRDVLERGERREGSATRTWLHHHREARRGRPVDGNCFADRVRRHDRPLIGDDPPVPSHRQPSDQRRDHPPHRRERNRQRGPGPRHPRKLAPQRGTLCGRQLVGDSHTRKADARIIAATNVDLRRAIIEGQFREDLFYRLRVVPMSLSCTRRRKPSAARTRSKCPAGSRSRSRCTSTSWSSATRSASEFQTAKLSTTRGPFNGPHVCFLVAVK